ncbi:hypothetical protein [Mycobacterium sp.]|uniref:hypothetical protein n=1 Tax=Mycobacterium sp. TaxID=1785 RepID=UPI0025DD155D|nr:hypothetical protein [Mycobacterium sp.]
MSSFIVAGLTSGWAPAATTGEAIDKPAQAKDSAVQWVDDLSEPLQGWDDLGDGFDFDTEPLSIGVYTRRALAQFCQVVGNELSRTAKRSNVIEGCVQPQR